MPRSTSLLLFGNRVGTEELSMERDAGVALALLPLGPEVGTDPAVKALLVLSADARGDNG